MNISAPITLASMFLFIFVSALIILLPLLLVTTHYLCYSGQPLYRCTPLDSSTTAFHVRIFFRTQHIVAQVASCSVATMTDAFLAMVWQDDDSSTADASAAPSAAVAAATSVAAASSAAPAAPQQGPMLIPVETTPAEPEEVDVPSPAESPVDIPVDTGTAADNWEHFSPVSDSEAAHAAATSSAAASSSSVLPPPAMAASAASSSGGVSALPPPPLPPGSGAYVLPPPPLPPGPMVTWVQGKGAQVLGATAKVGPPPAPPKAKALASSYGPKRSGIGGGRDRTGASGGQNRQYYQGLYKAKGEGRAAMAAYIAKHGKPPGKGGGAFHKRKGQ